MFNLFTSDTILLRPGIIGGLYPERRDKEPGLIEQAVKKAMGLSSPLASLPTASYRPIIEAICQEEKRLAHLNELDLAEDLDSLRTDLRHRGMTRELKIRAFAHVRATAKRTLGMHPYESQLIGGWVMSNGMLAEMETGEGKTLAATLTAATAGLAGIPVHIITVNDYLVVRDAQNMEPLYNALGLKVGAVTSSMDNASRQAAYRCDITYCTNKQVAFDYLRDRIVMGNDNNRMRLQLESAHNRNSKRSRSLLRGLCFAIVDEADSVLIDEARTPLIISRQQAIPAEENLFRQAMHLADQLVPETHFDISRGEHRVSLNSAGSRKLEIMSAALGGVWNGRRRREELVRQALSAQHLFRRDKEYLVHNNKVYIIDANTGRIMPGRSWELGLHQLIEIKEKCAVTGRHEHMARLTYQRFFRRYLRLAGMTGTAREVSNELWSVYGLHVRRVPTHRPCLRHNTGRHIFLDKLAKWQAVVQTTKKMFERGRPVLIGTTSIGASEHVSRLLTSTGIPHQVLNARQDENEARKIARAGMKKQITVATNMAGRGTDIPLAPGVAALGGLHVIATEPNEAKRIDRQLYGRCARQGDPGSYETIISLEDDLVTTHSGKLFRWFLYKLLQNKFPFRQLLCVKIMTRIQQRVEQHHKNMRQDLLQQDKQLSRILAFSGPME
jgi:preprotein translocase subunit SecA